MLKEHIQQKADRKELKKREKEEERQKTDRVWKIRQRVKKRKRYKIYSDQL